MSGPNHIDVVLYGYRTIQDNGVDIAQRGVLNIVGATIADNAGTGATDLTIDPASLGADVDPTEDTLVLRGPAGEVKGAGVSVFEDITAQSLDVASVSASSYVESAEHKLTADVTETRPVLGGAASPSAGWTPLTGRKWTNATVGGVVEYDLDAPNGCTIDSVTARIDPADTHVGMPAAPPKLLVYEIGPTGTIVNTWVQDDTSADLVEYEPAHDIVLAVDTVVDTSDGTRLVVVVQAESSTNALTGTVLDGLRYTRTRPAGSKIGVD